MTSEATRKLQELTVDLKLVDAAVIAKDIFYAKQQSFDLRGKSNKQLAHVLSDYSVRDNFVPLKQADGELTTDSKKQADIFVQYYQNLYRWERVDDTEIRSFLGSMDMTVLTGEHRKQLDRHITMEEVVKAISTMKNNNAPDPDGLTPEFYKIFSDILSPLLYDLYTECFKGGDFPNSWKLANMEVIPKKGQDL